MEDTAHLFDEFLDPVIITKEDKSFVYANNAFLILFQTTIRKLKKSPIGQFLSFEESKVS